MRVIDLKALTKEHGLRGYSGVRKAELIELLQNNPPPASQPDSQPRPGHPMRPPPPPLSQASPSVRFRPDRSRQPELLRQLNERQRQRQPSLQEMDIFE